MARFGFGINGRNSLRKVKDSDLRELGLLPALKKANNEPEPLPCPVEVDLYYRGLPSNTTPEEYDRIIAQENDYFDWL